MITADKALLSHRQNSKKPFPSGMGFFYYHASVYSFRRKPWLVHSVSARQFSDIWFFDGAFVSRLALKQ